jgi:toluene monooxygenase system protein A
MLPREEWLDVCRKLDWHYSYVTERDVFPEPVSGTPWLPHAQWKEWEEPFRTTYAEYVTLQHAKDASVYAVRDAVGRSDHFQRLAPEWRSSLKLHAATLPLAEFAAVIGNLRAARFGRDSAWRMTATFGALDELRHTQIPLLVFHELVRHDAQFDWTQKFYHTNNWISIAARHLFDEILLTANPIEFAIATNFVFETGFTNLQFVGLSSLADVVGDHMFEKMITSIQTDEARHAQIGPAVLRIVMQHDPEYAQYLADKWFWRSWLLFSIVTGFSMDYLTPLSARRHSFKEFIEEWVLGQYVAGLEEMGLRKPWYWDTLLQEFDLYHHMVYASAYTYRATAWFDFVLPGPEERRWLRAKYPRHWDALDAIWDRISTRWEESDPDTEWGVHGATPVGFCGLCQLVLCNGSPGRNSARVVSHDGRKHILCSEPCAWIFEREVARYADHQDIVQRILAGAAPANVLELTRKYFGLTRETWGRDAFGGRYPWLRRTKHLDRAG